MATAKRVLDNGLTVLLHPVPTAPAVSVWVGYKVGSRDERPGITGATHWVEHMLFKGGGKLKKGDIDHIMGRLGGQFNGFTDTDFTMYYETVPPDHLDDALIIESERMRNASFDPVETEAERGVVISEREGAENSPEYLLTEELWHLAFHAHPYHWPVVGWKSDLERITRDELFTYYQLHYAPNHAVLAIAGRFSERDAMGKVRAYFSGFRPERAPLRLQIREPPQEGERRSTIRRPGTQDRILIGYRIPELGHEDTPALLVLQAILGGWHGLAPFGSAFVSRSNRLYRALVDTRLATEVEAEHQMKIDPGLLTVDATVREGVAAEDVEGAALGAIDALRDDPPTKAEVDRARRQIRVWNAYDRDGSTSQAMFLTWSEILGHPQFLEEVVERTQRVTPAAVRRVAKAYLGEAGRTVGTFLATGDAA